MENEIRCVVAAGDLCGEGAVWHSDQRALYWTDINRFLLHKFSTDPQTSETWFFDEPVTSVNLTTDPDKLLLVFGSRVGLWSKDTHPHVEVIYRLAEAPSMRFNDACVDPRGSLWAGTMRNNVGPHGENLAIEFDDGVLYRIDPDGRATIWKRQVGIANTIVWSPDRTTFYFGDTPANTLFAYDYDERTGAISRERIFLAGHPAGVPDGSTIDADGFLWNTRPQAGCLIRIAPSGRIDRSIHLPVAKPTTCMFGGTDLSTLYITSARSNEQFSGSLFAIKLAVGGLPARRFRLL